ncbi:MAG: ABC transporter permease [Lachnospiraceae bacterium]|nr:ABC transporter permease [Lachnospiraceae bacterium]
MKALSAGYYIKENKGRAAVLIILLMLTVLLFTAGNYIDSVYYYWDRNLEYDDRICLVDALSTDEEYHDFTAFMEELKKDEKLIVFERSALGFAGLEWTCTMGFEMGNGSVVFNTPEDLKEAFALLGIECDLSRLTDRSVVLGAGLAKQYGLKAGDTLDSSVDDGIKGSYTVAALIDDDSYILFYVVRDDERLLRANVMSKEMSGQKLRDYLMEKRGDLNVKVPEYGEREEIERQFAPFRLIFLFGIILLSVIHAVTVNTVLTGQFIKRSYEFAIFRAIGMTKAEVFKKCLSEVLTMDAIGIIFGGILTTALSFLLNELYYIPKGQYLPYYSNLGLAAFLLSNLLVVLPGILSKSRAMARADITAY